MSSRKKRILIFIDWFYPAYKAGGPIKSVYHITENLSNEFDFFIVCSNQDLDGEILDVKSNAWQQQEHAQVAYLDQAHQNRKVFQRLYEEVDPQVIYYNNMFSFTFGIKPLWQFRKLKGVKQLIAPRGMLGKGALQFKAKKKKLFLGFAKLLLYSDSLYWHASTKQEALEIKKVIGSAAKVQIAQNLSSKPQIRARNTFNKENGKLKLVFISRISEKKNLNFLLKLLNSNFKFDDIYLDIYGPIENGEHWQISKNLISENSRIKYCGTLKPHQLAECLQQYHFYVLPTLNENFGHSIVEAWLSGLPVIISKNTPWQDLNQKGIGAALTLGKPDDWIAYIKHALQMTHEDYAVHVDCCFRFASREIQNPEVINDNEKLFKSFRI